jgi:ankyrin repeat protein
MMTLRRNPMALSMALAALSFAAFARAGANTSVLDAVASKDKAALRTLLKNGADVNAAMGDGLTAIHQVAIDGDTELAQLLIYAGANLKATTRLGGYTPLLLAAKNGDAAMIETLLKGGADPNQPTTNGTSPLMFAAASGNVAAVKALLDKGADIASKEKAMGQTPLMFAAANGRVDVVKLLVSRGADVKATTRVVDLSAFTREAEEAFAAAVANAAPTAKKPAEGEAKPDDAVAPESSAVEPDATTAAAKAAGLGGATTLSAPVNAPGAAKAATKTDDKSDKAKADKEKKEAAKTAKADKDKKGTPELKDAPPKVALAPPPAGKPAADAKATPPAAPPAAAEPAKTAEAAKPKKPLVGGVDRAYLYNELVAATGGMTPLHLAIRQGQAAAVKALVEAGADVNLVSGGDKTSPLLMAIVNGQFDLALYLLDHGANPNLASENGAAPLYAVVNVQWAPKAGYPQPRAYLQQKASYLDVMKALIDKGAVVDARLKKKVWYQGYNFDLSGVDETGATAFWRAAYASDIAAMKLLVAHGADPNLRTIKAAGRPPTGDGRREVKDLSGLPPVPVGGPAVTALQAAAGVGYGEGFAANSHRFAPSGMLAAVKYLVEELHADVNAADHEGNTALHHAAARGDNEMIKYLVSKGANVMAVSREGKTTVDMANSPVSRIEPFPATIALLESMGARNNHRCVSCDLGAVKAGAKQ